MREYELSGIYKITNKVNGKFYVGSGHSIFYRWYNHTGQLKREVHTNYKLQRAFNKYGFSNFIFEVLELHEPEGLNIREQYYLDSFCKAQEYIRGEDNFFVNSTYNIKPLVDGLTGLPHKLERIIKSNRARGIGRILKVNSRGEVVALYELQSLAAEDNNVCKSTVGKSAKKKIALKDRGFGFIYEKDYFEGYIPKEVVVHNKGIKGVVTVPQHYKTLYCYDIYGRFFKKFESVTSAAQYFNTNTASISRMTDTVKNKILHREGVHLYQFFSHEKESRTPLLDKFKTYESNGKIEVYNLFHEYMGEYCKETISEILDCHVGSVTQSLLYGKVLKGFYFNTN